MRAAVALTVLALGTLMLLLLGFGLLWPDGGLQDAAPRSVSRRVFRLPQGARRETGSHWSWRNETVMGVFRVYAGSDAREFGPRPQAGQCCKKLDGRLFATESYEIEAANDGSFSASTMTSVFASAAATWEAVIGDRFGPQISISESAGLVFNGRNQIGLGELDIDVPNALAVTGLWMTCPTGESVSACPGQLEISEWDQTYAIAEREWGVSGAPNLYDLPSVAVHEFGHNVGLDDLDADACVASTMYGFSSKGETLRRDLDGATIECARAHYGISGAGAGVTWQNAVRLVALLLLI